MASHSDLTSPLLNESHGHSHESVTPGHSHADKSHGHGHDCGHEGHGGNGHVHEGHGDHGHGHADGHDGRGHAGHGHDGECHGHGHDDEGHGGLGHDKGHDHGHGHDDHGHGHGHGHDDESHGHGHGPAHGREDSEIQRLKLAVVLAFIFMLVELVGGVVASSVAIMTDAAHMTSDFGGFVVTIATLHLAKGQATSTYSYGFKQAEVIGALANILVLWCLTCVLCLGAVYRLVYPEKINGPVMCFIGGFGVAVNLVLWLVMAGHGHGHSHGPGQKHDEEDSLGMRAAIAHRIGDLVQSLGVFVGALLIFLQPCDIGTIGSTSISRWAYADPICTFLFAVLVYKTSETPFWQCLHVLMAAAPQSPSPVATRMALEAVPCVAEVHDLHLWSIGTDNVCATAHISTKDSSVTAEMLDATTRAARSVGVYHTTFQLEPAGYSGACHQDLFHGPMADV